MSITRVSATTTDERPAWTPPSHADAQPPIRRAFLLVLTAIVLGLAGLYLVRAALVRKEEREDAGQEADPLTSLVVDLPRRLGIHIGR